MQIAELPKRLKLMVLILKRGKGEKAMEMLSREHNHFNMVLYGEGTANAAVMDLLGLTDKRRDVVFCVLRAERVEQAQAELIEAFHMNEPGNGIAFTLPINSVGGMRTLRILASHFTQEESK